MALQRRRAAVAAEAGLLNYGFDRHGALIRSEIKIQNQMTNFLRWLASDTLAKLRSPADVVATVAGQVSELHPALSLSSAAAWAMLPRFWQWPLARCSRSSEEFIRCMGQAAPIWLRDEYRWEKLCEDAERLYQTECRFEHVGPIVVGNFSLEGRKPLQLECGVHGMVTLR